MSLQIAGLAIADSIGDQLDEGQPEAFANLRYCVEDATRQALCLGWEHIGNKNVGYSEERICSNGVEADGNKGAAPVAPGRVYEGHNQRGNGGNNSRDIDDAVGTDAMQDHAREESAEQAGDRGRNEADRSLDDGEFLHVLEEEVDHLFKAIKGAPDDEDVDADRGEGGVFPERVTDEGWFIVPFLVFLPEHEADEENARDGEIDDCRCFAGVLDVAGYSAGDCERGLNI